MVRLAEYLHGNLHGGEIKMITETAIGCRLVGWVGAMLVAGFLMAPTQAGAVCCVAGDTDCDGFVDVSDLLTQFGSFTGPGSFGAIRALGDFHGDATGVVACGELYESADGDVDISDILLGGFMNFTGPGGGGDGFDSSGLTAAEALDPSVPDLVYDAATGEVVLDADGSAIIGYVLKNGAGTFVAGNHTPVLAGVTTSTANELSEAAFAPAAGSIGFVFPTGMDLAALTAYLSTNQVSSSLGAPVVPFDLVVQSGPAIPEPTTAALAVLGLVGMGLVAYRRRRAA